MKIVLGEAKEEYDTDVQMAVTRQLILRVNTEIKPEEAYVVSEITYSQRTGYSYTLINTQTKVRDEWQTTKRKQSEPLPASIAIPCPHRIWHWR